MEIYKFEYIRNEVSFANKKKAYFIFLKRHLADYYCFDISNAIYKTTYNVF